MEQRLEQHLEQQLDAAPMGAVMQYLIRRLGCKELSMSYEYTGSDRPRQTEAPDNIDFLVPEENLMVDVGMLTGTPMAAPVPGQVQPLVEALAAQEPVPATPLQMEPKYVAQPAAPAQPPAAMPAPPPQQPAAAEPVVAVMAAPLTPIEIVKLNGPKIVKCDDGTLMRLAEEGGFDPEPFVPASKNYEFQGIDLGNSENSRKSYLQCAAATAIHADPQLLQKYGLAP